MYERIKYLYPNAEDSDFTLQDDSDGKGPRIVHWNTAKLGPQPGRGDLTTIASSPKFLALKGKTNAINKKSRDEMHRIVTVANGHKAAVRTLAADQTKTPADIAGYDTTGWWT